MYRASAISRITGQMYDNRMVFDVGWALKIPPTPPSWWGLGNKLTFPSYCTTARLWKYWWERQFGRCRWLCSACTHVGFGASRVWWDGWALTWQFSLAGYLLVTFGKYPDPRGDRDWHGHRTRQTAVGLLKFLGTVLVTRQCKGSQLTCGLV